VSITSSSAPVTSIAAFSAFIDVVDFDAKATEFLPGKVQVNALAF
jgi:hypothetical protein